MSRNAHRLIEDQEGKLVAVVGERLENDWVNARLIAAAPDLLAACKKAEAVLRSAIERLPERYRDREDYRNCVALLERMGEATHKAEEGIR